MSDEEIDLKELFGEIITKKGAYSMDVLKHAENVMGNSSRNAIKIKTWLIETLSKILKEGENGEASDCANTARYWLKNLGEKTE